MKKAKHSTIIAITAVVSAAALFTAMSKSLHAGPGHYDGYRTYGYDPRFHPPAPPGYRYHPPGMPPGSRGYAYPTHPAYPAAAPNRNGSTAASTPDANTVTIAGMQFQPATLRIEAGDKVTWTNSAAMPHTVTGTQDGGLSSGQLGNGTVFTHTFNEPGTYTYYCALHPSMTGTVIVD